MRILIDLGEAELRALGELAKRQGRSRAAVIHDTPTCRELIDRIMGEAEHLIRRRLPEMLAGDLIVQP